MALREVEVGTDRHPADLVPSVEQFAVRGSLTVRYNLPHRRHGGDDRPPVADPHHMTRLYCGQERLGHRRLHVVERRLDDPSFELERDRLHLDPSPGGHLLVGSNRGPVAFRVGVAVGVVHHAYVYVYCRPRRSNRAQNLNDRA